MANVGISQATGPDLTFLVILLLFLTQGNIGTGENSLLFLTILLLFMGGGLT